MHSAVIRSNTVCIPGLYYDSLTGSFAFTSEGGEVFYVHVCVNTIFDLIVGEIEDQPTSL